MRPVAIYDVSLSVILGRAKLSIRHSRHRRYRCRVHNTFGSPLRIFNFNYFYTNAVVKYNFFFFNGERDPQRQKCLGPMKVILWP